MHEDEAQESQQDLLDLNEIMQAFGVDEWKNLGPLASSPGGLLQIQVEVQGQRYLLKERAEGLATLETGYLSAFQQHLRDQGIPVAPLRLTSQGEPYVTLGEDAFELQEWVEGELFDSRDTRERAWVTAAGEMLGRLHQASLSYAGPEYHWPSEVAAGGLTQGWLNFARGRADQCEVYAIGSALSNLVDAWEGALPSAMMAIGTGRALPEFHIHGDYSALNLRFTSRGVSQVLSLEASRWEKRLLELAYGVFYFAGLEWHAESGLTRPLVKRGIDPERASLFLHSYGTVYPAVPGESALLVDALALVAPIITANGPLEDIFYSSDNLEETLIEDALDRLAWAEALPSWLIRVRRSFAEMW
jgi:Ser/Thr protein kinase RdoA (MazF antagonist)